MSVLFKINSTDFTAHVVVGSYEINSVEETDTYVDAAETTHHIYLRSRIKGKLDMAFRSQTEYAAFVSAVTGGKNSTKNAWLVTVTPNNTLSEAQTYARVSFTPARTQTAAGGDIIRECTVELEEL